VDFGALPPEVNSARMYAGAGSGPLVVAASAWDGLALALSSAAKAYQVAVVELTGGQWLGAASVSMAAAAFPYVAWMNTTAAQAELTANQARSAVAAYEAAFAATVPPPVIAANRSLLTALVATNIFGQNTAAIAATEADYGEMWAQDAAAMYGYARASAASTTLTPFSAPSQNTDPAGISAQAVAVGEAASTGAASAQSTVSQMVSSLSVVPNALGSLASGSASFNPVTWLLDLLTSPLGTALNTFSTALSIPLNDLGSGGSFLAVDAIYMVAPLITAAFPGLAPAAGELVPGVAPAVAAPAAAALASVGGADISAGLGRAASLGALSVPQAWGSAAPEIRLAARGLPLAALDALPRAEAAGAPGWFGGMPPIGSVVNAPRIGESASTSRFRHKVIPQIATGGSLLASPPDPQTKPTRRGSDGELSERERHELNDLRQEMAELAMERDAVARLIKEAIRP
jgi:PPE-repeat protein